MSKITRAAKGQECTLRIFPDQCTGRDTVVFCHFHNPGKGMGRKGYDFGAFGCFHCHNIIDGRVPWKDRPSDALIADRKLKGAAATFAILMDTGILIEA